VTVTNEFDTAADNAATGGIGGPSYKFDGVGDTITGEIVSVTGMDVTVYGTNPAQTEFLADGSPARQMAITLKTDLRNWDRVAKLPTNQDGTAQPPSEDEGLRNLYANVTGKGSKALFTAISRAIKDAGLGGAPKVGARLQVKLSELRPTNKGNPAKLFEARYAPPAAASEFDAPASSAAAAQPPAPAPQNTGGANPWAPSTPPSQPSGGFSGEPPF